MIARLRLPDLGSAIVIAFVSAMVAAMALAALDAPCVVDDLTGPHACAR
jgi:hypothetical protein